MDQQYCRRPCLNMNDIFLNSNTVLYIHIYSKASLIRFYLYGCMYFVCSTCAYSITSLGERRRAFWCIGARIFMAAPGAPKSTRHSFIDAPHACRNDKTRSYIRLFNFSHCIAQHLKTMYFSVFTSLF